jgi:hypothetical protein
MTQSSLPAVAALKPFEFPVRFVYRGGKKVWPDLFDGSTPPNADDIPHRITEGEDCWIAQTYLRLWQAGVNVAIADSYSPDSINVAAYYDLVGGWKSIVRGSYRLYVVAIQHDTPRPEICDRRIVQNELNVLIDRDHFIPHWPQPGLIPRDTDRGDRMETISFKGSACNLYHAFRAPEFLEELGKLGLEFEYETKEAPRENKLRWHDYRRSDLILAVRDATEADLRIKPASKLVNAWLAGTPALLGPEPAFQSLRRSELDFIEVRTPADVLAAVRRLRENPALYPAMVRNGLQRGEAFRHPRITEMWHGLLAGPATEDFRRFRRRPRLVREMLSLPSFVMRVFKHKRNRKRYSEAFDHGYRPISDRYT